MRVAWLVVSVSALLSTASACGDDGDSVPAYQARLEAAQARMTDATCACLWTDELRQQCAKFAGRALDAACQDDGAARLAREEPWYAECVAETSERQARCLEEAACSDANCLLDAHEECGPVPASLDRQLLGCLPRFRCRTGQEITLDRRCDGSRDCYDKSDEKGCR